MAVIAIAAEQHLDLRVRFRAVDVLLDLIERLPVDHRTHEVGEIGGIADSHVRQHAQHALAQLGP